MSGGGGGVARTFCSDTIVCSPLVLCDVCSQDDDGKRGVVHAGAPTIRESHRTRVPTLPMDVFVCIEKHMEDPWNLRLLAKDAKSTLDPPIVTTVLPSTPTYISNRNPNRPRITGTYQWVPSDDEALVRTMLAMRVLRARYSEHTGETIIAVEVKETTLDGRTAHNFMEKVLPLMIPIAETRMFEMVVYISSELEEELIAGLHNVQGAARYMDIGIGHCFSAPAFRNDVYGVVKRIGPRAFQTLQQPFMFVDFSRLSAVTHIEDQAFATWYDFTNRGPDLSCMPGLKYIGRGAFAFADRLPKLAGLTALEVIENGAFTFCEGTINFSGLTSLSWIGDEAFGWASKQFGLSFLTALTHIGIGAFSSVREPIILSGLPALVHIGANAFDRATGVVSLFDLPSLTTIGAHAFQHASGPICLYDLPSLTTIGARAFFENTGNVLLNNLPSLRLIDVNAFHHTRGVGSVVAANVSLDAGIHNVFKNCRIRIVPSLVTIPSPATEPTPAAATTQPVGGAESLSVYELQRLHKMAANNAVLAVDQGMHDIEDANDVAANLRQVI